MRRRELIPQPKKFAKQELSTLQEMAVVVFFCFLCRPLAGDGEGSETTKGEIFRVAARASLPQNAVRVFLPRAQGEQGKEERVLRVFKVNNYKRHILFTRKKAYMPEAGRCRPPAGIYGA